MAPGQARPLPALAMLQRDTCAQERVPRRERPPGRELSTAFERFSVSLLFLFFSRSSVLPPARARFDVVWGGAVRVPGTKTGPVRV